mmetsp:Transcript_22660/g.58292  ORF Transcript_22660/g.58292 Transcript_22660/m.58292 type:complete len:212 (-) Transcript_22660:795-1430(-)
MYVSLGSTSHARTHVSPSDSQHVRDHFQPQPLSSHREHTIFSSSYSHGPRSVRQSAVTFCSCLSPLRLWMTTSGIGSVRLSPRSQCWMCTHDWIFTTFTLRRPPRRIERKRLYEMPASSWCHMCTLNGCRAHSSGEWHLMPLSLRVWALATKPAKWGSAASWRDRLEPMHTRLPPAYGKGPTESEQFSSRCMSTPWSACSTADGRASMPQA